MTQEISDLSSLPESVWEVTGKKAKHYAALNVQLEVKSEKFEPRLLIAAEMRLYVVKQKPLKLETNVHYNDISLIKCLDLQKMTVGLEGKQLRLSVADADVTFERVLKRIFDYLSIYYNKTVLDRKTPSLELSSEVNEVLLSVMLAPDSPLCTPCGNLSMVYRARCDQLGMHCYEDVAWDVDAIYNSNDCHHFDFSDFEHLSPKHLIPLLASFENNPWFININLSNLKLTPEVCVQLLRVLRENSTLQELDLTNTGIKSDFLLKLAQVLTSNIQSCVTSFDLSNNPIDDKGISHLIGYLSRPTGSNLVSLNLSGLPLTYKTISSLADCLQNSGAIRDSLTHLNLSNIPMKAEENISLHSFLAQPNHLRSLKLTNTEYPLENLFAAALRGCSQHLETLDVSGCLHSKKGRDTTPDSWKQFFSSMSSIKSVDLSNTKLPSSAVLNILEGLESNSVVTNVSLNLSGCQLGQSQGISQAFHQSLPSISKLKHLDLSDNGLDHLLVGVFKGLAPNKHLKELSVGRNVHNAKPKILTSIVEAMVAMLQHQQNGLERLSVDGLRLRQDTTLLLNSLVTNNKLLYLDISGNQMGDVGMKMLSKALLLNRKLCSVVLDNNQVGIAGMNHLAAALEKNTTLQWVPVPLNDMLVTSRTSLERLERTWKRIEASLLRNQSEGSSAIHYRQDFALEQWISNSFEQEVMGGRMAELSGLIEQVDALKLKRKTSDSADESFEAHFGAFNACKKAFYEAKRIKKFFLEAYDFCGDKRDDDVKFVHQMATAVQNYIEWLSEQYDEKVKQEFHTTLAVNSADELLHVGLTKEEGASICSQVEALLHSQVSASKHSILLDRAFKYNDLLLNSAPFSTEQAICNAKSVCSKLSNQMIEEGLLGDHDPEYLKLKRMIDIGDGVKEVKRRSRCHEGVAEGDGNDEDAQSQRHNSNKVMRPLSNYATNLDFSSVSMDIDDGGTPTSPTPHSTHQSPSSIAAASTTPDPTLSEATKIDLDDFDGTESSPRLTHLAKDRPRRTKNKAPSRPAQRGDSVADDLGVADHKSMHSDVAKAREKLRGRSENEGVSSVSSTPTSSYSRKEEAKIPLPVIRSKNKAPELPTTRPKYTPKNVTYTIPPSSVPESPRNVESDPPQVAPTPMRRQVPPGSKGLLIPSMHEINAKRVSMRHVPNDLGSQPCLSTQAEKAKRLTDFSCLDDDGEVGEKKGFRPVPPLPPKPSRPRGNFSDIKAEDNASNA